MAQIEREIKEREEEDPLKLFEKVNPIVLGFVQKHCVVSFNLGRVGSNKASRVRVRARVRVRVGVRVR